MNVLEAIERTYSWLHPAGVEKPSYDILTSQVTAVATSIPIQGRQPHIDDDALIEFEDGELTLLSAASATTLTAFGRGYMETNASTHASGERILIRPIFTRQAIFNTIVSLIDDLPGMGLWRLQPETATTLSTTAPVALPASTKGVRSPMWVFNDTLQPEEYVEGTDFAVIYAYDPPRVQFLKGRQGAALLITLQKEFSPPTGETQDLTDTCGVPAALARHVPMAAAGTLLQARDLPKVAMEDIRRQLANEQIPVGAATSVSQMLLSAWRAAIARERDRQLTQYPVRIATGA